MLEHIEIVALLLLASVVITGLLMKFFLRKRMDDIDGISEVLEEEEGQGKPVAKL